MPREINRLNWKQVAGLKEPGLYADGQGLYLRIDQTGARRWVYIFYLAGRRREMGFGSAEAVKLGEARQAVAAAREIVRTGGDPITIRRAAALPPEEHSFAKVATTLLDDIEGGWKSPKQRGQWEASLKQHAGAIWAMDVAKVDTDAVVAALRPIWLKKPETASRVRGRIERILDAAKVRGLREGENPARWKGHLTFLLPPQPTERGHHAAMPYGDVPAFLEQLSGRHGISAMALEFLILTAARTSEVLGARWEEIRGEVWTIPAERMKAGRVHRVHLSTGALKVLAKAREAGSEWVFPGQNGQLSGMALEMMMRKMGAANATPHGFRSSFRDWVGDCTSYPDELAEHALAHVVGSKTERAYRRGDALERRGPMMEDWSAFCSGERGQVIPMAAHA